LWAWRQGQSGVRIYPNQQLSKGTMLPGFKLLSRRISDFPKAQHFHNFCCMLKPVNALATSTQERVPLDSERFMNCHPTSTVDMYKTIRTWCKSAEQWPVNWA
jgi:hypothetical protein